MNIRCKIRNAKPASPHDHPHLSVATPKSSVPPVKKEINKRDSIESFKEDF